MVLFCVYLFIFLKFYVIVNVEMRFRKNVQKITIIQTPLKIKLCSSVAAKFG